MLFTSVLFSQVDDMVVKYVNGDSLSISLSSISKIYFPLVVPVPCGPTVDYSGVTYNTVLIGSQCWFKENLRVGAQILGSSEQTNNSGTNIIEKYCYNDVLANCETYGGLYQWAEAVAYTNGASNTLSPSPVFSGNVQGICPTGWHIPTQAELQILSDEVAADGNSLKALGQGTGGGAGTNTSGFTAGLFGYHQYAFPSGFYELNNLTYFWSWGATEKNPSGTYRIELDGNNSDIVFSVPTKFNGHSVRCLRD